MSCTVKSHLHCRRCMRCGDDHTQKLCAGPSRRTADWSTCLVHWSVHTVGPYVQRPRPCGQKASDTVPRMGLYIDRPDRPAGRANVTRPKDITALRKQRHSRAAPFTDQIERIRIIK